MLNKAIDLVYVVRFLRTLTTPWTAMDAFRTGVINATGDVIVPKSKQSEAQKDSYSKFDVLVWNLKKLIEKVPLGKSTVAKYTAALALLKEDVAPEEFNVLVLEFAKYLESSNDKESVELLMNENFTGGIDMVDGGRKKVHADEEHAGDAVFHVDPEVFHKSMQGKSRYARYKTYVGEDEIGVKVKDYAKSNPNKNVMLKDKQSGALLYLRRKPPSNVER